MGADWQGSIFLGQGWLVYAGRLGATTIHRHHAAQVLVARRGTLDLRDGTDGVASGATALVPANEAHGLDEPVDSAFLLYVEPESGAGRQLRSLASASSASAFVALGAPLVALRESPVPRSFADAETLKERVVSAVAGLPRQVSAKTWHPAVSRALTALASPGRHGRPTVAELASSVGLSTGRFSRVFNRDVGMSVPAYLRWLHLRRVAKGLRDGESLTAAAHAAGFSDSAHLSRVFRATFGVCPSEMVGGIRWSIGPRDDGFVQATSASRH